MKTSDLNKIFSVKEITAQIKTLLESSFKFINIRGEISNCKKQSSGHLYFNIKDSEAQISAVFFRGNNYKLTKLPKDGDEVIVQGEIGVYPPRGSYQIIVRDLQFAGTGELLLKLHALKGKLQTKGWFDNSHKKPLPSFPQKIGVITSSTGAVIRDILHVLSRRLANFHLILYPVKVQGEGAGEEIARAIRECNQHSIADVLIVCRGGGSLEDLWAYNEEIVAEAIFHSNIPIVSAVGHESDYSIADFVADVRAATPSAAAEIISQEQFMRQTSLQELEKNLYQRILQKYKQTKQRFDDLCKMPIISYPEKILENKLQDIDVLQNKFTMLGKFYLSKRKSQLSNLFNDLKLASPFQKIEQKKEKLKNYQNLLDQNIQQNFKEKKSIFFSRQYAGQIEKLLLNAISSKKSALEHAANVCKAINPKNLLQKGYSILFSEKDSSIILSTKQLNVDDKLRIALKDGEIISQVIALTQE